MPKRSSNQVDDDDPRRESSRGQFLVVFRRKVQTRSRSDFLEPILMVKFAENGSGRRMILSERLLRGQCRITADGLVNFKHETETLVP
jgi:hypothetical protein